MSEAHVVLQSAEEVPHPKFDSGEVEKEHEYGQSEEEDDDGEGDGSDNGEDEDEDEDMEDDAEAIARRLGDQLWADIQRARAGGVTSSTTDQSPESPTDEHPTSIRAFVSSPNTIPKSAKEVAALVTMRTVLAHAATDPLVHSTLMSTPVPGFENTNVLAMLSGIAQSGTISKEVAGPLSQVIVRLAKSEILFSPLPTLPTSALKRKRDEGEGDMNYTSTSKRTANVEIDLHIRLAEAVKIIKKTLEINLADDKPVDPLVVASVQPQLHQVFLFAVTFSSAGGMDKSPLQEISGLIQILGVLVGIQIAPPATDSVNNTDGYIHATNIGAAVYPCLHPGCGKIFARLFSLRQHHRAHTVLVLDTNRPYKCSQCPASFARSHDLKRHAKSHGQTGFRCGGCKKIFSRRDAIKRHKAKVATTNAIPYMPGYEIPMPGLTVKSCEQSEIEEILLEGSNAGIDGAKEGRRAKMWNGISNGLPRSAALVDGEIPPSVLGEAQGHVTSLHSLLQAHVAKALASAGGIPAPVMPSTGAKTERSMVPFSNGQTTLASVIARATADSVPRMPIDPTNTQPTPLTLLSAEPSAVQTETLTSQSALSSYVLNEDQTKLLEQAIAHATAAAQAQAEAEAALEELESEESEESEDDELNMDIDP